MLVHDGAVTGLIDFGDVVHGPRVYDLAVGLAYALLDQPDLVATTRNVVGGYVAEHPLTALELQVVFDLVAARLAMSVAISSHRSRSFADNDYLLVSQAPALALLARLMAARTAPVTRASSSAPMHPSRVRCISGSIFSAPPTPRCGRRGGVPR